MSGWDGVRHAAKVLDLGATAFEVLEHALGKDGTPTMTALAAARAALKAIQEGTSGKRTPQEVLADLEVLRDTLKTHDAEALQKLHDKFADRSEG